MTLAAYQREQIRMLLDPEYRRDVTDGRFQDPDGQLSVAERRRLSRQAADPGFALACTLHEGWRLTKLMVLLPRTFAADADDEVAALVVSFWRNRPSRSLYFEEEALDFAALVGERARSPRLVAAAAADLVSLQSFDSQYQRTPGRS